MVAFGDPRNPRPVRTAPAPVLHTRLRPAPNQPLCLPHFYCDFGSRKLCILRYQEQVHWFRVLRTLIQIPGAEAFVISPNPQANNHGPSLLEIRRPFVEERTSQIAQVQRTQRVSSDAPYCDAELPLQDQSPALAHVETVRLRLLPSP